MVPEKRLAAGNQADVSQRLEARAGCPHEQGLSVPHEEISATQAQEKGLAGLIRVMLV